jgi:hypothetical protein
LCLACTERRLGRSVSQADLVQCPLNAGWLPYDPKDAAAEFLARGRWFLPPHGGCEKRYFEWRGANRRGPAPQAHNGF